MPVIRWLIPCAKGPMSQGRSSRRLRSIRSAAPTEAAHRKNASRDDRLVPFRSKRNEEPPGC
jgi:hypothetical protein